MAIAYKSQGAGVATETSGAALSPLCPATVDAGDILIAHVFWEGTTTAPSTPSGWDLLDGPRVIETTIARHWVFGRIADGSEDGAAVAFGSPAVTTQRGARIYSFSGRVSGAITQLVTGFAATSHGTDPQMPTVTTTKAGALAVALVAQNDNNTAGNATGESGGDWVEAVAEFVAALTPGLMMQIQTATPTANPGTISGGSVSTANDPCGVIGFQILDELPSASIVAVVAEATSAALLGTIQVARSVPGELATATAVGLDGVVTTQRIVSITGELASASAAALDGTITTSRITSVVGELATADADGLSGSIQIARSVPGEAAEATAETNDGTITAVRIVTISGETVEANADSLEAVITAAVVVSISGELSQATAEALDVTITTIRIVSISGELASATADALVDVIQIAISISGEISEANSVALDGIITSVRNVSISGELSESTADSLDGVVSTVPTVNIQGEVAAATAEALDATITSVRVASVFGEVASATSEALEGTIDTGSTESATVDGEPAAAIAVVIVAAITTVRFVIVTAELAIASATALSGSILIQEAEEVTPIMDGFVDLEDLIDRQIWPDNVDPTGVIFPTSPPIPSGYIDPVEEINPSGFQKQSDRTELWNL